MSSEFIAQGIGLLGSAIVISAFAQKSDTRFKAFAVVGNIIFAIHFLMLGAYAGLFINLANAFRNGLSIKYKNHNSFVYVFIALYLVIGGLLYESLKDIFPIISGVVGSYGMYKLSGFKLRACFMISSGAWLVYGIIYKSVSYTHLLAHETDSYLVCRLLLE